MRIALISPPPYKIQEAYYDTPPYPRTTLAHLMGVLLQHRCESIAIDCKFSRLNEEQTLEKLRDFKPDVVGFTAFSNEIIQAASIAEKVKKEMDGIITLIGGVHVSAIPEETLREFPQFDYAIVGEGEATLLELLEKIGSPVSQIQGVASLENNVYTYGGERPKITDYSPFAVPAWKAFAPADEYILHTQRGCPYNCPFCMNPNGRKVRPEPLDRIFHQIKQIAEYSRAKHILFGDEIFTIDRKRVFEFCDTFQKEGFHKRFTWSCLTHLNCMDYELAIAMKKAHCIKVGLGVESGSVDILKAINKATDLNKAFEIVKILKKAKLPFESYFILGQPNETRETVKATVDTAVKINADYPVFGIMVPYPHTKIHDMAKKGEGGYTLVATSWNDYNKQIGNALEFANISRKELERYQLVGYIMVFLKNGRFFDFLKMAFQYRMLASTLLFNVVRNFFPYKRVP